MSPVVANASPLIVLAKADMVQVLAALFSPVLVPQAVRQEIEAGPAEDPMKLALPSCSWLAMVRLEPPLSPLAAWQLGRGEAEVIEYPRLHGNLPVLLDDRAARRAAEAWGCRRMARWASWRRRSGGVCCPRFPRRWPRSGAPGFTSAMTWSRLSNHAFRPVNSSPDRLL